MDELDDIEVENNLKNSIIEGLDRYGPLAMIQIKDNVFEAINNFILNTWDDDDSQDDQLNVCYYAIQKLDEIMQLVNDTAQDFMPDIDEEFLPSYDDFVSQKKKFNYAYEHHDGLNLFSRMFDSWYQLKSVKLVEDESFQKIIMDSYFEEE